MPKITAEKMTSPMKYQHYAVVKPRNGYACFPIDMLRYDRCMPLSEWDSNKVINTFNGTPAKYVVVTKFGETAQPSWTPERWQSFGWELEEVDRFHPATSFPQPEEEQK